ATHALDFGRFPLVETMRTRTGLDAGRAVDAVVEGHAQFVAERVAARWKISAAFERFTKSITALPKIEDDDQRRLSEALVTEIAFGYVQGHSFIRAVHAARGLEGVDAVLREPPSS